MKVAKVRAALVAAALLSVVAAAALAGCAGLGRRLESPRITLADIRVKETSGFESVFEVRLRVLNPNEVDLEVKGVDCELEVNGQPFASGVAAAAVKIPAHGSEVVPITAYAATVNILRGVIGLHKAGEIGYRLKGRLALGGDAWIPPRMPFETSGTLDWREFAGIRK